MQLHRKIRFDLLYIMVLSLALAAIIYLGDIASLYLVRIILGLLLVIFSPGYTLLAAVFPGRDSLGGVERFVLSFGLSIALIPLMGLALNYTPWGIRSTPILISLVVFILIMSGIAQYWRSKLPESERFIPSLDFELPALKDIRALDWILSVVLILIVLFTAGSIYRFVVMPKIGEKFTEFSILGPDGKAEGYPTDMDAGVKSQVIVDVVNHEYDPVNYTVEVMMGDYLTSTVGPFTLNNGQQWENPVDFTAYSPHTDLKVEFLLFREGDSVPYRSAHLWVNVRSTQTLALGPAALAPVVQGVNYKVVFSAKGGTGPYTFSESGTLPRGLTFNGSILAGRPMTAGSFAFTISAEDSNGITGTSSYTLIVGALTRGRPARPR